MLLDPPRHVAPVHVLRPLALTIVLNLPTAYYFRGIAQSNAGFRFQPNVELKFNLAA